MQLITPVKPAQPVEQRLHRGGCLSAGGRDFGAIRAKSRPPSGRAGYPGVQTRDRVTVEDRWPTGPADAGTGERGPRGPTRVGVSHRHGPKTTKPAAFATGLGIAGARVGIYPTAFALPAGAIPGGDVGHEAAQEAVSPRPAGPGDFPFRWGTAGVVDAA